MTILLVDQDVFYITTISKLLNLAGIKTISVSNGHGAWDKFETFQYRINLVITDLPLLGINGIRLTKLIRGVDSDLPIIVVSSMGLAREEAFAAGATAFLEKPFLFDTLLEEINKYRPEQGPDTG
ncbi:response regulator receiver domain-containing protein [Chitinophaga polysaccharea]|uniref:Response regulator receiver domain-containing protein n=1 Tax=Chitinophaga polysaccharea TaxID=1293035 RepID=A0A561PL71_9BACT|nr:response regulator [Chitinophaga polysaccharea]TWF38865.1 response regulator receiver domain-containing protein [Chitinophaga polysaccharea]